MPRYKKKASNKSYIVFLPLFLFAAALILTLSLVVFQDNSKSVNYNRTHITDGSFDETEEIAYFMGEEVTAPTEPFPDPPDMERVLSAVSDDEKWVEVDLTNQRVRAWEGNRLIYEFVVSTGKRQFGTATPTGAYRIWIKLRSTKMSGGSGSTYYYLPNVQCTQYFNNGYALHGCYWHENYGHPMSHGCINMRNEDACTLFYWTSPPINGEQTVAYPSDTYQGTRVVVHGDTPWE